MVMELKKNIQPDGVHSERRELDRKWNESDLDL